ncbi:MAG: CapA family protein [Leptolyngbya sp. SIO1E4]|nr:CapA family protein [Leptolyngbya sp. SIO1E4]
MSTKALAAAGQFRAIACWLNEPLIPQGIYVQVQQDNRPGCLLIVAEFERPPEPKRLTQYLCHLVWQLNSPVIEGIHLVARSVGQAKTLWEHRVRIMTPALKARLSRQQGSGQHASPMPPAIAHKRPSQPPPRLVAHHLKTLRAFMLTGSAVAAFVFGCLVEIVMSPGQEPSLPLQNRRTSQAEVRTPESGPSDSVNLPNTQTVFAHHAPNTAATSQPEATPAAQTTSVSYRVQPNRPNVVNSTLEPVGVIQHERLLNPAEQTVTLVFGGDVSLDDLPYSDYETDEQLLSGISAYQQADVAMVNLDASLATAATSLEEELLDLQRPDVINLLKAGGVDIVSLTSEEVLAFGEQGLAETLETLDRNGIYRVGAGRSEREARRPEILDVKGQRIAYLSYDRTESKSARGAAGGVNAPDKQEIVADIQAIRDEVDWLVVNYRWTENIPEKPADFQTNLARLAIDQGADLVVGHHPTQLQGAEIYKGRPIAYSLGDFVFGKPTETTTPESAVLQVSLRDRQMKVDLIPVKVRDGQPQRVNESEAAAIFSKIQAASKDFETPMSASVVLDAQPIPQPEVTPPDAADSDQESPFVDEPTPETDHSPLPETEAGPFQDSPDEPLLNVPLAPGEASGVEMEPIPEGLLDNWGPKNGSGTLYEPESVLPENSRFKPTKPAVEAPGSKQVTETEPAEDTASAEETLEAPAPMPTPEAEKVPAEGAIAPYSEPLIGPLSALPPDFDPIAAELERLPKPGALVTQEHPGLPQARVLEPLNSLKATPEKPLVIDVQKQAIVSPLSQD